MGVIKRNEDGTYRVRHEARIPGLKTKWSKFKTGIKSKTQAEKILRQMITEAEINKGAGHSNSTITFDDAFETCLKEVKNEYAGTTMESFETTMRKWCPPVFGGRPICQIRNDEIRTLIYETMVDKSISQQKNLLKYIKRFFRHCMDKGWLDKSPVPILQFREIKKLKAVLTQEQFERLLNLAKETNHEWYPVWSLAVMTGLRNGELFALQWDQVDTVNRRITVSRNWDHKGGFRDYTKSKNDRKVEFPERLLPLLQQLKVSDPDSPFVLPRVRGWTEGRQAEILRAFLAGAGLPGMRFHDLRATWATFLLGQGIPPAKVMAAGGWNDLKTVMHYLRIAGVDIVGASKPFDRKD
jgi:integrase